jgi:zinc protease
MDERTGVTGIAHVLEHLMSEGTHTVPAGEFSKRISAAAGAKCLYQLRLHRLFPAIAQ